MALSPTMPDNSSSEPYTVEFAGYSTCGIQFKSIYIHFLLLSQQKFKRGDFDNFQPMMWSVRRSRKLESSSTKFSRWTRSRKRSSQSWELSKNGLTVQYLFFSIHFYHIIMMTVLWPGFHISIFVSLFAEEGRRLVEMEKYKLDLVELRDSIYNKSTNTLDYNRLRCSNHLGRGY